MIIERDSIVKIVRDELIGQLGDTYDCTRCWTAWQYGTMRDSDFVPVNDRVDDIVDGIVAKLEALTVG